SLGADPVEVDRFERRARERLVSAREIADVDAEEEARIEAPPLAEEMPPEPPPLDVPTGDVPRPDDHVGPALELRKEGREVARVVASVGVHLHEGRVTAREAEAEAVQVG